MKGDLDGKLLGRYLLTVPNLPVISILLIALSAHHHPLLKCSLQIYIGQKKIYKCSSRNENWNLTVRNKFLKFIYLYSLGPEEQCSS
jgi:hypothetical protein